jgi:hypothetical protein
MTEKYNIYCDESCHLEHDHQTVMVLGAIWCPSDKIREIAINLREIKSKHNLPKYFEIKWTKVSPAKNQLYLDLVDYFFDNDDLHFRAIIIPDKTQLRHEKYHQNHDTFYYKVYFDMLKIIFQPKASYRIYLDIKDTCSSEKVTKLHDVLCNNMYDFDKEIIERVQVVRSHEIELIQLCDLLIGAVSYTNRKLQNSPAKVKVVERIRQRSGYTLTKTTLFREDKFNIFSWQAS